MGTREALIDAAARLLDSGGVEAVTLREVGHQAGVSHNAPYKHFPGKEALLAAVATRELAARVDALTAAAKDPSPEDALRQAMHSYIASALERPARFKLVYGKWTTAPPELAAVAHTAHERLVAIVVSAQDAGTLPAGDPERLAALVRALAHGAADLAAVGHLEPDGKGHASPQDLVDDLLRYLATAES